MILGRFETGRTYKGESLALLRELPDDSIDALITDPPYSSGGFTRGDRNQDPGEKYCHDGETLGRISFTGDNRDGRSWAYWMALWLSETHRAMKTGGYALVFCDWRQLPLATDSIQAGGFVWRGVIAWDKTDAARAPHKGYFRHQCEYVVWGSKGPLPVATHAGPYPGCYRIPTRQADKLHMTGKPTHLMRQLVKCVRPGGIVLDPFSGSGTTIAACAAEGRHGLGFECEEANVGIANGRMVGA